MLICRFCPDPVTDPNADVCQDHWLGRDQGWPTFVQQGSLAEVMIDAEDAGREAMDLAVQRFAPLKDAARRARS